MVEVRLYKNPDPYPYYSNNLSLYKTISATPRNVDLRTGFIDVQLNPDNMFAFNYLSFKANSKTMYAWVENVEHLSGNKLYRIHYATDPFRTYRGDLVLGKQYIVRSPLETLQEDPLLSSADHINEYERIETSFANQNLRYCVVQQRPAELEDGSNTPGQPSPYKFYFVPYDVNNWMATTPIRELVKELTAGARSSNIVTIYSIPHVNLGQLIPSQLFVSFDRQNGTLIDGWYVLPYNASPANLTRTIANLNIPPDLTKTRHSVSIIIPEAGIMRIPDEFLYEDGLCIQLESDIFSGASNYMLCLDNGATPTHISIRGGSLSTIPILSDPYDTYISQNQNALAVGMLGDVASLGAGIATMNPVAMGAAGMSLVNTFTGLADAQNAIPSNPPAFLGSALVSRFNKKLWVSIMKKPYDNETEVRERYGYPLHRIGDLSIPQQGFIQTQNCSVSSNGNVPLWAINEINQLFNAGILFK